VSSKIDTLEPRGGEPLPIWLASIAVRTSAKDLAQAQGAPPGDKTTGDIARQAEQAIAGVPLGLAAGGNRASQIAALRSLVAERIGASVSIVREEFRTIRGAVAARAAVPSFRKLGFELRRRMRSSRESAPRVRSSSIGTSFSLKLFAAFGAAALGLTLVVVILFGRLGSPATSSADFPGAPTWQTSAPAAQTPEERPAVGIGVEFTRANIRYCTFQQIRLEALGPVTEGADLVVFNALVADWNARCTRYRYRSADKDAVDAEATGRRALLEVEGRALMNSWRRKIVTTVQQRPASAGLDTGEDPAIVQATAESAAKPGQASDAIERLPLLITLGRAAADEPDRDTGLSLRTPSLALLRADVAMRVQRRLNDLGYAISPVDGTWGTVSRNALRRFKQANGLLGNDAFDAETVTRLFSTSAVTAAAPGQPDDETGAIETAYPPPPAAGMNPLNRGDGQRIQQRLTELGYYSGHGEGAWGTASRNALRGFKAANGLPDDDEWNAMAEAVLFDEQAVRAADATAVSPRSSVVPTAAGVAVPLPPKRPPPPPAKAGESTPALAPREAPRPPGLIPAPAARVSGAATRPSP
jgi:peptidoglycan hydrolase-like protein with peptidoglycan-binding domain